MLRRHSDVPAVIVGPDDDAEASAQGWPAHSLVTPLNLPSGSLPCFDYARDRRPEYGFRLHKVPALLRSPFTELTVFLDADVLVLDRSLVDDLPHHVTDDFKFVYTPCALKC